VVFLLDRSGSMQGWKIVAARRAIARMIDTLCEDDLFRLIAFDDRCESPPGFEKDREMAQASDRNRFQAVEFLAGLGARGGTEIAQPLDRAVALLAKQSSEDRDRILVLVTDGQVGNEDQVLQTLGRRLKGIRVFTLGIDQAVNEGFLRRLAERGGGACELVESEERLDEVMQSVHRRIGTPILKGLHLEGQGISIEPGEIVPRRLPDLFSGSPLVFLGRYHGSAEPSIRVCATDTAGSAWSDSISGTVRDNPAIACAWARGQIRQLEDNFASGDGDRRALERAIVALSLRYQVLCRFTAYVAIDRSQAAKPGGSLHRIIQPVETPAGWGAPVERVEIACASLRAPDAFSRCLAAPPQRLADLSSASSSTFTSASQVFRCEDSADPSSQIDALATRQRDADTVAARPSAPSGDSYSLPPRFENGHGQSLRSRRPRALEARERRT
jgi:Ca-activated chloride channel family protein